MSKRWYVIHTYSGFENQVKASIQERIKNAGLEEYVSQILIPTEEVVEVKKGKKKISPRKFFPGYIIIEMEMTDEVWYIIKSTPKVTGFLGGLKDPTPIRDDEVERLLQQIEGRAAKLRPKVEFEKGEVVRVIQGPFTNFTGVIDEVHPERGKLKLMVSIFGRSTPLELEFVQVERV
jgi:transcriptional antiterminator NusG